MSIQQRKQNFNSDRMIDRAYNSIDNTTERIQNDVADTHASIVLDEQFWNEFQNMLIRTVAKRRQLFAAGGYTDAANEMRLLEDCAIRTAIEDFRAKAKDNPHCIHNPRTWDEFRLSIRKYAEEFSFP